MDNCCNLNLRNPDQVYDIKRVKYDPAYIRCLLNNLFLKKQENILIFFLKKSIEANNILYFL